MVRHSKRSIARACAIFGAPFPIAINGKLLAVGKTFSLDDGDRLRVGSTRDGARGYLCVAGGFDAPRILGSSSSLAPLASSSLLRCRSSRCEERGVDFASLDVIAGDGVCTLRVLPGLQRQWFPDANFFEQTYRVNPASDRMGIRLMGQPLDRITSELVSEVVVPGAVQITNDGLPVVLGVDGQTIGGYPKIAHVIRADLDRLAQLRPHQPVRFIPIELHEAEAIARARSALLNIWRARLRASCRPPRFEIDCPEF